MRITCAVAAHGYHIRPAPVCALNDGLSACAQGLQRNTRAANAAGENGLPTNQVPSTPSIAQPVDGHAGRPPPIEAQVAAPVAAQMASESALAAASAGNPFKVWADAFDSDTNMEDVAGEVPGPATPAHDGCAMILPTDAQR